MDIVVYQRKIDLGPKPSSLCLQRWSGELSPEPETVSWLESLRPGEELFDIGASIGTISVRAAVLGLWVTAFEPHEASFNELLAIAERNGLPIACCNIALSDVEANGRLYRGRSKFTFYANTAMEGQPIHSRTLDTICSLREKCPEYLKIDVDGNETQIIVGGAKTIQKAKSVLIEVDPKINSQIPGMMKDLGFHYDKKQVEACMIREGKYKGTANYIFNR